MGAIANHLQRLGGVRLGVSGALHELHALEDVQRVARLLGLAHDERALREAHQPWRVLPDLVAAAQLLAAATAPGFCRVAQRQRGRTGGVWRARAEPSLT